MILPNGLQMVYGGSFLHIASELEAGESPAQPNAMLYLPSGGAQGSRMQEELVWWKLRNSEQQGESAATGQALGALLWGGGHIFTKCPSNAFIVATGE